MRNDFKMIVFKQLTISIKTQNDNKISFMKRESTKCYTTHVKHDHQYGRNFKSLNRIWCIVCFFLHLLRRLIFFLKKCVLLSPCWMQSALRLFTFYTIFTSYIATLRNYQPVAWVFYQRVIDQSKADIFIKPGISVVAVNIGLYEYDIHVHQQVK